jgi:hypothetical protein
MDKNGRTKERKRSTNKEKSRWERGYLPVEFVCVVDVEAFATGRSLVQCKK